MFPQVPFPERVLVRLFFRALPLWFTERTALAKGLLHHGKINPKLVIAANMNYIVVTDYRERL